MISVFITFLFTFGSPEVEVSVGVEVNPVTTYEAVCTDMMSTPKLMRYATTRTARHNIYGVRCQSL